MGQQRDFEDYFTFRNAAIAVAAVTAGVTLAWAATRYRVAQPDQVFAVVGPFIRSQSGIKITQRVLLLPYQKLTTVSTDVRWLNVRLSGGLTRDKMHVDTPFKIAVRPSQEHMITYLQSLSGKTEKDMLSELTEQAMCDLREIVATRDIDDVFGDQSETRRIFAAKLQEQWRAYGIDVINCVPEYVGDPEGSQGYFYNLSLRQMERSRAEGDIGTKEQQKRSRVLVAAHETEAVQAEQGNLVAQKEATAKATQRMLALQQEIELLKISQEQSREDAALAAEAAKLRSRDMARATVENEVKIADVNNEATRIRTLADVKYYAAQKEADAVRVRLQAEADGLKQVLEATNGTLNDYRALKMAEGVSFKQLMDSMADGVRGAQPKVTILATGADAASKAVGSMNMTGLAMGSALDSLRDHFGITVLPDHLKREAT